MLAPLQPLPFANSCSGASGVTAAPVAPPTAAPVAPPTAAPVAPPTSLPVFQHFVKISLEEQSSSGTASSARCKLFKMSYNDLANNVMAKLWAAFTSHLTIVQILSCLANNHNNWSFVCFNWAWSWLIWDCNWVVALLSAAVSCVALVGCNTYLQQGPQTFHFLYHWITL